MIVDPLAVALFPIDDARGCEYDACSHAAEWLLGVWPAASEKDADPEEIPVCSFHVLVMTAAIVGGGSLIEYGATR